MENWKSVVGFEGLYEVSDHGRVRSVKIGNHINKRLQGKILKARPNAVGYPVVSLYRGGKSTRKERVVHRLVLKAFVGPAQDGCEALHGDGSKINNHLPNLRWGTRSENIEDKYRCSGLRTQEVITSMKAMVKTHSLRAIGRKFGVVHGTVGKWINA